jgi:hypothetical protein
VGGAVHERKSSGGFFAGYHQENGDFLVGAHDIETALQRFPQWGQEKRPLQLRVPVTIGVVDRLPVVWACA